MRVSLAGALLAAPCFYPMGRRGNAPSPIAAALPPPTPTPRKRGRGVDAGCPVRQDGWRNAILRGTFCPLTVKGHDLSFVRLTGYYESGF